MDLISAARELLKVWDEQGGREDRDSVSFPLAIDALREALRASECAATQPSADDFDVLP